jgi:hypothetical protein
MIKKLINYLKKNCSKKEEKIDLNVETKSIEDTFADIRISLNKNFTVSVKVDLQDHSYEPLTTIEYAMSISDFINKTLSISTADVVLSILDQQIRTKHNASLINKIKSLCFYNKEFYHDDVFIRPSEVFIQNRNN